MKENKEREERMIRVLSFVAASLPPFPPPPLLSPSGLTEFCPTNTFGRAASPALRSVTTVRGRKGVCASCATFSSLYCAFRSYLRLFVLERHVQTLTHSPPLAR